MLSSQNIKRHSQAVLRLGMNFHDCTFASNVQHISFWGQLLRPWYAQARLCSSQADAPLIVSAEAAHVAARRHINLVHIPDFIASPPVEQVKALGLRVKNMRQISANLRDAEKCLALTQEKGGGRHAPIYLPTVPQLKGLNVPSRPPALVQPSTVASDPSTSALGSSGWPVKGELEPHQDVVPEKVPRFIEQKIPGDGSWDAVPEITAPRNITVNIGGRRDLDSRSRPALPPTDPAAASVGRALARAGFAGSDPRTVRNQTKNLAKVSDTMFGPFPEQAALFLNPFKEEKEMRNIHPLSSQRRPAEAAKALAASSKLVERADDKTAVAFAATSLPARYATIFRILEELKFKDKRWKPTTLLDYASGPGCGMWASMQVWNSIRHMTAIEPRQAMVRMGLCIQDALASEAADSHNSNLSNGGHPFTVPSIRWLKHLPKASPRSPRARDVIGRPPPPPPGSQHSLVISAHVLTRLPTHAERMRTVRDLWNRVEAGGVLVLVEAGTPVGSSFVRQAREQILREEVKRQAQIDVAISELVSMLPPPLKGYPTWDLLALIESSGSSCSGDVAAQNAQLPTGAQAQEEVAPSSVLRSSPAGTVGNDDASNNVLQSAWQNVLQNYPDSVQSLQKGVARLRWLQAHSMGAHVAAPCAHDGVCPMDNPGMEAWCHFSQRVERRFLHRQCRYRKGNKNGPKNWEYEHYSYVVLRRSPRPPPPRDVYIAPAFRQYEEDALNYVAMPPALVKAAQAGADAALDPLEVFPFFKDGAAAQEARANLQKAMGESSAEVQEDADLREEEKADAAEDLKAMKGSEQTRTGMQDMDDLEVEDSVEEAARAEATQFLDDYLNALLNDESMPAKGALHSLRLRMEDAGVLPASSTPFEPSGKVFVDGMEGPSAHAGASRTSQRVVVMQGERIDTREAKPEVDVWGAPSAGTSSSIHGRPQMNDGQRSGEPSRANGASSTPFMHLGTPQDAVMAADDHQQLRVTGRGASDSGDERSGKVMEDEGEPESLMLRGRDWAKEDPEGVAASRESCSAWSRIVRKPLKRGKHVVLDLCVASRDQRSGQLERHIVAHSDRQKAWLGPAAYRLARHAKWGDLWPSIYHKNPRVRGWQ